MEQLDLLIRGAAIALTTAVALRPIAARHARRKALAVAALGVTVICYLLISPPHLGPLVSPVFPVLVLGAKLLPMALTWTVLEIFYDRPAGNWAWMVLPIAVFVASFAADVIPEMAMVRGWLVAALYVGLIVLAIRTDADDLVAPRRRFRRVLVIAMALLGVTITAIEVFIAPGELPMWIFPLQASAVLVISAAYGAWTLSPVNLLWAQASSPKPASGRIGLAGKVTAAMDAGAWRTEGLSIGALSAQLQMPEYRLRAVINGDLGYRNFSTFVNGYRIAAAKQALTDPDRADTTVLEIAYEVGFASLGPFNRAFRAETGLSPTEYRGSPDTSIGA